MNRTAVVSFSIFALNTALFGQVVIQPAVPPQPIVIRPATLPASVQPPPAVAPDAAPQAPGLVFDADSKEYNPQAGETSAPFVFSLTNVSSSEIIINSATTSCGCTVAQLPEQPWHLAPGANGEIKATMNLVGKMGHVTKQITVNSSVGIKSLLVHVNIPAAQPATENLRGDRNKNMELAKADRQAVFKGDCRSCHVDQGVGKTGKELYASDCGICHDSNIRAAMVPDLRAPKGPRDHDYWVNWIASGRPGSMMPAFAEKDGGPLSTEQINSLAKYLMDTFPSGIISVPPVAPKSGAGQ